MQVLEIEHPGGHKYSTFILSVVCLVIRGNKCMLSTGMGANLDMLCVILLCNMTTNISKSTLRYTKATPMSIDGITVYMASYYTLSIRRDIILHDIAHSTIRLGTHKTHPYLGLNAELWMSSVSFWKKWLLDIGSAPNHLNMIIPSS